MTMYNRGRNAVFSHLGITKEAVSVLHRPSLLRKAKGWLLKKKPTATGVRDFMIGNPKRFGRELVEGRALGKGSLVRESLHAPDALSKVMFYGLPAVETAGIALDDEGNKAKRIGQSVGGAALGLAAYRPLGMVGSIAADAVGRGLGGGVGQAAGHVGNKIKGAVQKTPEDSAQGIN